MKILIKKKTKQKQKLPSNLYRKSVFSCDCKSPRYTKLEITT